MWDFRLCDNEYTDGDDLGTDIPRLVLTKYDVSEIPEASSHLKCTKTVPVLEIDYISIFCGNILL